MHNKRWALLAGIVVMVMLLAVASQTAAQEETPPLQPASVEGQAADVLWDQLSPVDATLSASSYVKPSGTWGIAADDFVVTSTPPVTYTAWIVSQVVVRASVGAATEASVCFYGDNSGKPTESAFPCYTGLAATANTPEGGNNSVLTYTVPSNLLFFVGRRYWLSVQMDNAASDDAWYWRARPAYTYSGQPFAFKASSGFHDDFANCLNYWQLQTRENNCRNGDDNWPDGVDLSYKLVGSYFTGVFDKNVYLPLVKR